MLCWLSKSGYLDYIFQRWNIETADYHAGPVAFARTGILDLLNIFDQQCEEKEKELISDLEQDDDNF